MAKTPAIYIGLKANMIAAGVVDKTAKGRFVVATVGAAERHQEGFRSRYYAQIAADILAERLGLGIQGV